MDSYLPDCGIEHNQFEDNYHGILTHSGEIKVAKGDVEQEILYIDDDGIVLVDGGKNPYQAIGTDSICKSGRYRTHQVHKRRGFHCRIQEKKE